MSTSTRSDFRDWTLGERSSSRTAVYGPVRTVVWEGRGREAPPYPNYFCVFDQMAGLQEPRGVRLDTRSEAPAHRSPVRLLLYVLLNVLSPTPLRIREGRSHRPLDRIQIAPGRPKTRSGKIMGRVAASAYEELGDGTTLAEPAVVEQLGDGPSRGVSG